MGDPLRESGPYYGKKLLLVAVAWGFATTATPVSTVGLSAYIGPSIGQKIGMNSIGNARAP